MPTRTKKNITASRKLSNRNLNRCSQAWFERMTLRNVSRSISEVDRIVALTFNSNVSAFSRLRLHAWRRVGCEQTRRGACAKWASAFTARYTLLHAPQRRHFFLRFIAFDVFLSWIASFDNTATADVPASLIALEEFKIRNILLVRFDTESASTISALLNCFQQNMLCFLKVGMVRRLKILLFPKWMMMLNMCENELSLPQDCKMPICRLAGQ